MMGEGPPALGLVAPFYIMSLLGRTALLLLISLYICLLRCHTQRGITRDECTTLCTTASWWNPCRAQYSRLLRHTSL